jgi:hypothetical protein
MEKNVGGYDRIAQFILGPALIIVTAAVYGGFITLASGLAGAVVLWAALLVGAVFIVTASTQTCPLNSVLGINTYRGGDEPAADAETDVGPGAGRPM